MLAGLGIWVLSGAAWAAPAYRVSYAEATAALIPLVRAVYAELGLQPEFVLVPAERALVDADRGLYDAEISRVEGGVDAYPNLLLTRESLRPTELYAYARVDAPLSLRRPADLEGHSLGLLRGSKLAEDFVHDHGLPAQVSNSTLTLYAMLEAGRFEIALLTSSQVQRFPPGGQFRRVGPVLETRHAYHVLHRRHAALLPRFDAALRALKRSGRAEQLLRQGAELRAPPAP